MEWKGVRVAPPRTSPSHYATGGMKAVPTSAPGDPVGEGRQKHCSSCSIHTPLARLARHVGLRVTSLRVAAVIRSCPPEPGAFAQPAGSCTYQRLEITKGEILPGEQVPLLKNRREISQDTGRPSHWPLSGSCCSNASTLATLSSRVWSLSVRVLTFTVV